MLEYHIQSRLRKVHFAYDRGFPFSGNAEVWQKFEANCMGAHHPFFEDRQRVVLLQLLINIILTTTTIKQQSDYYLHQKNYSFPEKGNPRS